LLALITVIGLPAIASADTQKLTVTGRVTGTATQNLSVMLVANDGTGIRVSTDKSGKFTTKVPQGLVNNFVVTSAGKGPTLHIVKNGKYFGPVVLGKKNTTTGFTRLSTKKDGMLSVGSISLKTGYAIATTKSTTIDTKSTIRMSSSKPVLTRSVRQAALMGPVHSFAALTTSSAELGADADRDGLPNFADADVNGDGLLDAAQPDTSLPFSGISSDKVMGTRPTWDFAFRKIIRSGGQAPINSNVNPTATSDQIGSYLSKGLQLEIAGNINSTQVAGGAVSMTCQVAYCQPGTVATVVSSSNSAINGKGLDVVRNENGSLALQKTDPETRFALVFKPGDAVIGTNALTGDVFGFTTSVNGAQVANEVRILTSGVVSPAAFVTAGNQTFGTASPATTATRPTSAELKKFPITFFRPQDFAPRSTTTLVDRGGLRYRFVLFGDGENAMHVCRPSSISDLSSTLVKPVDENSTDSMKAYLFDSEQMPSSNGVKLGVSLNLETCLTSGPGTSTLARSGSTFNLYIETYDADGNESGENIRIILP